MFTLFDFFSLLFPVFSYVHFDVSEFYCFSEGRPLQIKDVYKNIPPATSTCTNPAHNGHFPCVSQCPSPSSHLPGNTTFRRAFMTGVKQNGVSVPLSFKPVDSDIKLDAIDHGLYCGHVVCPDKAVHSPGFVPFDRAFIKGFPNANRMSSVPFIIDDDNDLVLTPPPDVICSDPTAHTHICSPCSLEHCVSPAAHDHVCPLCPLSHVEEGHTSVHVTSFITSLLPLIGSATDFTMTMSHAGSKVMNPPLSFRTDAATRSVYQLPAKGSSASESLLFVYPARIKTKGSYTIQWL